MVSELEIVLLEHIRRVQVALIAVIYLGHNATVVQVQLDAMIVSKAITLMKSSIIFSALNVI